MKRGASGSFAAQLRALREAAGFTQEELATIAGVSVHAVSALERGERKRPHVETVRALSAALDLTGAARDALVASARPPVHSTAVDELSAVSLPVALTALLGRDADLQTLGRWLADPAVRLITLTGPGGAGKTRLALELARTIAAESTTRVVFVPLVAVRNPAFVASAIAEALGLSDVTALDLARRVRIASDDQPTLLVLDNFEHVLDAAPLVADLLTSVPSIRALATSRAPLRVRGEREYGVGPLALDDADTTSPADLARSPAVRLFLDRVRDVQPDFRLTPANGATVAAICRRLDALPLALEIVAPWIKVLSADDLLDRLTHGGLLSTPGPRDLPTRQQTMNATVAWSYQLLAPEEQRLFRRLGVLSGPFPIDAAVAVNAGRDGASTSDEVIGTVGGLIDKSLLLRAETSVAARPLYQMLETVRAYAAHELTATGEREDAAEGLARYCTVEASHAGERLLGPHQNEWLDRVRDDLESYRGALAWLIERGRSGEASAIAANLLIFWFIRGHATEGLEWYERVLALAPLPKSAEAKALVGAGAMLYTQGELVRAGTAFERALPLARESGEVMLAAHTQLFLGHVEHAVGNEDVAGHQFARSADGFRALALPWGVGNALSGMAWVALATGDFEQAERLLDEATTALQHTGPWHMLLSLYIRAVIAVRCGNYDRAIALARDSLTRIRASHDKLAFVYALVPLAIAAALRGDDAWAARILGARDAVTESTGVTPVDESVQDLREQAERDVRTRLGPERWSQAYAAGRRTSIDALLHDIDKALQGRLPDDRGGRL